MPRRKILRTHSTFSFASCFQLINSNGMKEKNKKNKKKHVGHRLNYDVQSYRFCANDNTKHTEYFHYNMQANKNVNVIELIYSRTDICWQISI